MTLKYGFIELEIQAATIFRMGRNLVQKGALTFVCPIINFGTENTKFTTSKSRNSTYCNSVKDLTPIFLSTFWILRIKDVIMIWRQAE